MWLKLFSFLILLSSLYLGYFNLFEAELDSEQEIERFKIGLKMSGKYSAFVLGGTGSIGKGIVRSLAASPQFDKVTLIGRRKQELPTSSETSNFDKFSQEVIDFDKISEYGELFKGFDFGFYSIGVSQAQVSEAEFRKIELDNALALAKLARDGGCKSLHWVTSRGTDKNSWFLFAKVKAQVEDEISKLGFPRVAFYRPAGILTPDNAGQLGPTAMKILRVIDRKNWLSVETDVLGKFIVANALSDTDKTVQIFENAEINRVGQKLP